MALCHPRVGLLKPPRGEGVLKSHSKREAVVFVKSTSNGAYHSFSTSQSQIEDLCKGAFPIGWDLNVLSLVLPRTGKLRPT